MQHFSLMNWCMFNNSWAPLWAPPSHVLYSLRHTPSGVCVPYNQVVVRQKCLWHRRSQQNHQTWGGNYSLYSDHPGAQPKTARSADLQRVCVLGSNPLTNYSCPNYCTFKGRGLEVLSHRHAADIPKWSPCNQNTPRELYFKKNCVSGLPALSVLTVLAV